jgi:hypothetical protein
MPCHSLSATSFRQHYQMKNLSVLALPCPCPCPCHVGDCGGRGKRCRFEPGSREIKKAHVPARPVMPALPHGLEILTGQHRLNFCTRHSPFDRVDGDQTESLKAGQAPIAAAEKFLFATRSILGCGRKCMVCCHQCHGFRSLHRMSAKRCAAVQNAAICLRLRYWQSTDNLSTPRKPKARLNRPKFLFCTCLKGCRCGRIIHDGLDFQCCTASTLRPFVLKPINIRLSQYTKHLQHTAQE